MPERRLEYVGRSLRDLREFPEDVQDIVVFALLEAQEGRKHLDAKPLTGFGGASVMEVALTFRTDAYRVVYTVRFPGVVYVLHAFKKKSKKGSETPKRDLELIRQRLQEATRLHAQGEQHD